MTSGFVQAFLPHYSYVGPHKFKACIHNLHINSAVA